MAKDIFCHFWKVKCMVFRLKTTPCAEDVMKSQLSWDFVLLDTGTGYILNKSSQIKQKNNGRNFFLIFFERKKTIFQQNPKELFSFVFI